MQYIKKIFYLIVLIGYSFCFAGSYEDFFSALAHDDARSIQSILHRGFDPNSVDPQGQYALVLAIRQSSWKVAQVLIADPSTQVEVRTEQDESPLMLAALKGQVEICSQLIAREAVVNKTGWTPLHYAASSGNTQLVQLLLEHYAYIDAESPNGSTPLMMAARYGSDDAVQTLLQEGADPTIKNALGLTALDFAIAAQRQATADRIAQAIRSRSSGSW
jgi:uncharacterized protein